MLRFLIHVAINPVTVAIALLVAGWAIPGVSLEFTGFAAAVAVFALAQGILGPFVFNVARQYASAVLGGIGLITTLLALLIASMLPDGLSLTGLQAWLLTPVLVWAITAVGAWILGAIFLRNRQKKDSR